MEFSKKILIFSYLIAIILTTFTCYCVYKNLDISYLSNITVTSWAEVSVGNAFYYWKARSENKIKLLQSLSDEEKEKFNISLNTSLEKDN